MPPVTNESLVRIPFNSDEFNPAVSFENGTGAQDDTQS